MDARTYNYLVYLEYNAESVFPKAIEQMCGEIYASQEAEGFTPCILEGSEEDEAIQLLRQRMETILKARQN